jgi:16S rRNA (adenine1518-N6/adenine1519-N6)-dimethyltransferase
MNIQGIKQILQANQSWAKKAYGQHFLVDESVLDTIIETAELKPADRVVEIGPGLGVLTERLLPEVSEVVAIEADELMVKFLEEKFNHEVQSRKSKVQSESNSGLRTQDLRLIKGDALQVLDQLEFKEKHLKAGYKVVANIPYSITSKLIRLFLENTYPPESLTLLVQKEVAERIVASPGEMSLLALSVQYYGQASLIKKVPASAFWPAPKVESAVLSIVLGPESKAMPAGRQVQSEQTEQFFRLARIGFSSRRKTLANNLSVGLQLEREKVIDIIKSAGLKDTVRAQELSVEDWLKLASKLNS